MNESVKERLLQFLSQIREMQKDFCRKIDVSKAYIASIRKSISPDKLAKIREYYPELNITWLLTGEGDMMNDVPTPSVPESITKDADDYLMVPVMNVDSVGGIHSSNAVIEPEYVERYIPMTGARRGDVAIYQSGNSMAPAIPSGAMLLIREVEGWRDYIGYGDVFVLLLTDERRITKEIRRYDRDPQNYYWCVSYNPDVANEELPKKMVARVWKVIKVLIDKGW